MTNQEKMDEQLLELAEFFKGMFTKEDLQNIEKAYEEFKTKRGLGDNEVVGKND